jgi:hypothetical protein
LEEADWSDMSSKSSQVRYRDDPHLIDLAFRKLFIGWRKLSRDAGVADKHSFSVVIRTRRSIKEIHYQFEGPFLRGALRDLEQSTRLAELILK